jgi:hypothetical protein
MPPVLGNGYSHHVFLSYRNTTQIASWVVELLLPCLKARLDEELDDAEAEIFHFDEDLHAGDLFPDEISSALRRSMVIVPVWSKTYFKSHFCLAELETFRRRPRHHAHPTKTSIVPVLLVEPKKLPEGVQSIQGVKFAEFDYTPAVLRNNPGINLAFEDRVKKLGLEVALAIQHASAFRDDFPIVAPVQMKDSPLCVLPVMTKPSLAPDRAA